MRKKPYTSAVKLSLFAITWPIFIESALQMLMRTSDTFMLSRLSDSAVAAVGVANQLIMFTILIFNVVSLGSSVVIMQYLGARKTDEIGQMAATGIALNFIFGLLMSLMITIFSGPLLRIFGLETELLKQAQTFLYIAGGALFIQALLIAVIAIIQAHGYTKFTMFVTIGMNALNILGNYVFIYGAWGFPQLGITGVAIATAFSQLAALIMNLIVLTKVVHVRMKWKQLFHFRRDHVGKMLKVGLPSSAVTMSYSINQLVTTAIIATLGAEMLAAKIYTSNIQFMVTILVISIGKGMQIMVGHLVGAGELENAYTQVFRNLRRSMIITLSAVAIIFVFRVPLLHLFTGNSAIVSIGATLLLMSFLLEPGRNCNVIIEKSLQAAGDARFAMLTSIIVTWSFSVPLTYWLGIHMDYGMVGIWAAFIVDEWLRGIILCWRWKSKIWERKSLVSSKQKVTV
ncbi:MATE family efflux transporter [Marinicrinis lubricantis]|uniref:MATE family efflux transporter n=1 Tax=Marinicrinis lubricantis TaxID=2086470 RepID=A0ABW1IJL1_9BACL